MDNLSVSVSFEEPVPPCWTITIARSVCGDVYTLSAFEGDYRIDLLYATTEEPWTEDEWLAYVERVIADGPRDDAEIEIEWLSEGC